MQPEHSKAPMADLEKRFRTYSFIVNVEADDNEIAQGESSAERVLADEIKSNLESLGTAVGHVTVTEAPAIEP